MFCGELTSHPVLQEAPRLVSSDGPTSPRTLVRRLNAVQRRKEDKESQMKELLAKEIASPGKVCCPAL